MSKTLPSVGLTPANMWHGVYDAVVYSINDPLNEGRVQLQIPQVMGFAISDWAYPISPTGVSLSTGSYVIAAFLGGDINKPVYFPTTVAQSSSQSSVAWINVAAAPFNADPSGIRDSTTDIQNAINSATKGEVIYFPAGTYKISNTLTVLTADTFLGDGENVSVIKMTNNAVDAIYCLNSKQFNFRAIRLQGPNTGGSGNGIHMGQTSTSPTTYVRIADSRVRQFGGDGIRLDNPLATVLDRTISDGNFGNGFNINSVSSSASTSISFIGTYAISNLQAGYQCTNMHYSSFVSTAADHNGAGYILTGCENVGMLAPGAESCINQNVTYFGQAFEINGGQGITLISPMNFANVSTFIWVTGNATRIKIINPFENSPTGTATASIQVDAGSYVQVERGSLTTATVYNGLVSAVGPVMEIGDVNPRWYIDSNGVMRWGGGSGATDTFLQRIGGPILQVSAPLQWTGASSAISAIQTHITGDTVQRLNVTVDGKHLWGSGALAGDATLYRASAGQLAATLVAKDNAGVAETWVTPGSLGTGYSSVGSPYASISYARDPSGVGNNRVWIRGRANVGSGTNIFTLTSAYQPTFSHVFPVAAISGTPTGNGLFIEVMGASDSSPGAVRLLNIGSVTVADISCDFPLD